MTALDPRRPGQGRPKLPPGTLRRLRGERYSVSHELLEAVVVELRRPTSDRSVELARAILRGMRAGRS